MKVTVLNKISSFLHTKRIDSFHYTMFHGFAQRTNFEDKPLNALNSPATSPLQLTLNCFRIIDICEPGLNLVATSHVAGVFQSACTVGIAPVIISGVARIPYEAGSMGHWDDAEYRDTGETPVTLLKRAAKKSGLKWPGPEMKEIVPYDGDTLALQFPREAFSKQVFLHETGDDLNVQGTLAGLQKHGLLWSDGAYCFREDVFAMVKIHFNMEYFATESFTL
jgi:hypothetical protein